MPKLIKAPQVSVITKDGECEITIKLEISIDLNGDGLSVSSAAIKKIEDKEDKVDFAIPDFSAFQNDLKFGKIEENNIKEEK